MRFNYNDGGRVAAGYKGDAGDCVCRAIAIAAQLPYAEVYERLAEGTGKERKSKGRTARNGINIQREWFKDYMRSIGFVWYPTMTIGSGCKVHLRDGELPMGRLVVRVSKHCTAVIDGVINDTHDPQRYFLPGRCVYGYWQLMYGTRHC